MFSAASSEEGPARIIDLTMRRCSLLCVAIALAASACSTGPESRSIELTFANADCTYAGPRNLTPGIVEITFQNFSEAGAWVVLVRIDSGRTVEEFEDWTLTSPGAGLPGFVVAEWTTTNRNGIDASSSVTDEVDLRGGRYAMACGSVTPDLGYFAAGLVIEE